MRKQALQERIDKYRELGKNWVEGEWDIEDIQFGSGKKYVLSDKQKDFLNAKNRYILYSGGYGAGKTLPLLIKLVLFSLFFPKNRLLLGRKNLSDVEKGLLPDLFDLVPASWYEYRVKDGIIRWFNGSEIILFALDALQSGSQADIKKAQQKLKSLNLGGYFIDQLEEVEKGVFDSLNARLRRNNVPLRQGNMTTNPANYWAYDYFVANPRENTKLIQGSMLDNEDNLPDDYIEDQLKHSENYVKRYVHGEWSRDVLTENVVIASEYIKKWDINKRKPIKKEEGCEIFENYKKDLEYQMGVDSSTGSIDPASISIVSSEGKKVAKFNGFITIPGLIDKTKFLYRKYGRPRIIPEANASGTALIEGIKDLDVYRRMVYNIRDKKETQKLGYYTNESTKKALIAHFQELVRHGQVKIFDKKTIEEFKTFVWSDEVKKKGAGAERNYHDDDVISTLLAFWDFSPEKVRDKQIKRSMSKKRRRKKKFQYI